MFLPREKKILRLLLKQEKKFTSTEIAAELNVNPRTIKTDIKRINSELEKHFCSISTKRGVGYWLECNEEGEKFLKDALYNEQSQDVAAGIRKYYIAAEVMNQKEYIAMEELAGHLYVSKATVLNDLNEMEDFWKQFDLTFIKKVKYGIRVEGEESQMRLALFETLKKITEYYGVTAFAKIQPIFPDVDFECLREIIKAVELRFDFVLTDLSFDEFMLQSAIVLQRTTMGCLLETKEKEEAQGERREYFIGQYLKERIEKNMPLELPDAELGTLISYLKGMRFQVPIDRENSKEAFRERKPEMYDYMIEILKDTDSRYLLNLSKDDELICSLFSHLECMIYRIKSQMYLTNPLLESVKKEMTYEYEIASHIIARLNAKYGIEASDDEIGYITFHVGASIERSAQKRKRKLVAAIVCMTGMGTSQFIAVKLKRLFPELEIGRVVSEDVVAQLEKESQDFIISTVPIQVDGVDVIQITPVLNENDEKKIRRYVQRCETKKEETEVYDYLKQYLHDEITILNCDLKSKEEVIELLGKRMVREGYAEEGYVEGIFAREKLSDTALGNLLAIPHALDGRITKPGIGLLTLQKPVDWGKEKAQVIFMLALRPDSDDDFQAIFKGVFELTKNHKNIEKLLKAKSFAALMKSL